MFGRIHDRSLYEQTAAWIKNILKMWNRTNERSQSRESEEREPEIINKTVTFVIGYKLPEVITKGCACRKQSAARP